MQKQFIPLSVPNFSGKEKEYVHDAVVSEWVSTGGSKVPEFEQAVADYVKAPRAVACNSGTAGLHLSMLMAGIGAGDEVIAPTLTFIAAVNPIRYVGANPIFIGCDDTLCISPQDVEAFLQKHAERKNGASYNKKTGAQIKAIVIVHVFGNMADMESLMRIAKEWHLVVIEDATEALGTYYTKGIYEGAYAGTIGDIGVYSFNGNKIITTGSGGMIVSKHLDWLDHAKHLSTQAKADEIAYLHDEIGYNYRLTNLQAALGLAQLEQLETFISHKKEMYTFYCEKLSGKKGYSMLPFREDIRPNYWFYSLMIGQDAAYSRNETLEKLKKELIQTRPIWALIHEQADYPQNEVFAIEKAQYYLQHILNIPCSSNLTYEDAQRVVDVLLSL